MRSEYVSTEILDEQIRRLLQSDNRSNVRLGLQLALNPAIRLQDISDLVGIVLMHDEAAFRDDACHAIKLHTGMDIHEICKAHWEKTHPKGKAEVLYAALKKIEHLLDLPKNHLQVIAARRWEICPSPVASRFSEAFLAWCQSAMREGRLNLLVELGELPKCFLRIEGLRTLNICHKSLKELPEWIGELKGVQELNLNESALKSLPESIGRWAELHTFTQRGTHIMPFPDGLKRCPQLRHVRLQGGYDRMLEGIEEAGQLESIHIEDAVIGRLPEGIGRLQQLKRLEIDISSIDALPGSLGAIAGLEVLQVTNSALPHFPAFISGLEQLRVLKLEYWERQAELPDLGSLSRLEVFELDSKKQAVWPKHWCRLPVLHRLVMCGELETLPVEFAQLQALRHVELNENPFGIVPEALLVLLQLEHLELMGCGLETLPDGFIHLKALRYLSLGMNAFREIPAVLYGMHWLEVLDLRNNRVPLPQQMELRVRLPHTKVVMG